MPSNSSLWIIDLANDATERREIVRTVDRVMRAGLRVGIGRRGTALLETRGRQSGQLRVTPVTNGLEGTGFWIVAEHGLRSDFVDLSSMSSPNHFACSCASEWQPTFSSSAV